MSGARDLSRMGLEDARTALEGLFDAGFYRRAAGLGEEDAFAHYVREGARRGLKPNVVFEPAWYLARNPDAAGVEPLLHYALVGEAGGCDPSPMFDVAWHRGAYAAERPLAHYLAHRFGPFSPAPEFDAAYYLQAYPDVGEAGLDPFQHYLLIGYREFRRPFEGFEPRLYALRHMRGAVERNPVAHMRAQAAGPRREAPRPGGPHAAVRRYTRAGPGFEPPDPPQAGTPRALVLAFYLPQFHRVPENDAFWGAGFTEWTALARGQPRFEGHYQPRTPGKLGFYDLMEPAALRAQAALARGAGIGAFVFYHYDFGGRRLLQAPVELFLAAPDIDIGFCLMWANENWTRRWDGAETEVLIAQDYAPEHESARLADFARHFRDPRYLRLEGRPVLMVYRASLIPDTAATLARWRSQFRDAHQEDPIFVMAQCFDDLDPRPLGFDAAIEFPPHKLTKGLPQAFDRLDVFDEEFEADVFAYDHFVEASLSEPAPDYPLIKTAAPAWDNDARRQGKGLTLAGATPGKFERWLDALIDRAEPVFGRRMVALNAWNEWSEGAYLEPDVHWGAAFLNAAGRAVFGRAPRRLEIAALGGSAVAAIGRALAAAFGVGVAPCATAADARGKSAALADSQDGAAALAALGVRAVDVSAEADAALDEEEADRRLRAIFTQLLPDLPKVSALVVGAGGPRLASLFAQTHPLWEIVVLDDDEAALDAAEAAARAAGRDVTLTSEAIGVAVERTSGDFIWRLEGAGRSTPRALARLAAPLAENARRAFAFCDSRALDSGARPRYARPSPLDDSRRPLVDGDLDAEAYAARIVAAPAAALWRRDALVRALAASPSFDLAELAVAALAEGARAAFVAEDLELTP